MTAVILGCYIFRFVKRLNEKDQCTDLECLSGAQKASMRTCQIKFALLVQSNEHY